MGTVPGVHVFRDILVPVQFDASAARAIDLAVRLAEPGGRVRLLHVVEWTPSIVEGALLPGPGSAREVREIHESARRTLQRYADRCVGVRADVDVVDGKADLAILEAAQAGPVDLILLGRGHRHGIVSPHIGSVVSRVIVAATCPVLLVPG